MKRSIVLGLALTLVAGTAAAAPPDRRCSKKLTVTVADTFDDGINLGGWSFGNDFEGIELSGGSPGAWLHNYDLATFAPRPSTGPRLASVFTGDYRTRNVVEMAVDLRVLSASLTTAERPLSLVFTHFSGTPEDPSDDLYVYFVGDKNIPDAVARRQGGWTAYPFSVPAASDVLPSPRSTIEGEPGWVATEGDVFTPAIDPDAVWRTVMGSVDQVTFWFHDPRYFAFLQDWNVGMDNPSVTTCQN